MILHSQDTALIAQKALCLEALADKEGCTTRYVDLEGRPLESFIISGINVGPAVQSFADDWLSVGRQETRLFHRFEEALLASQVHRTGKFVNFGLLEILFPAIAARLTCNEPDRVIDKMIELMGKAPASDVAALINARGQAWSTSEKRATKLADITPEAKKAANPLEFYAAVFEVTPKDSASYQWIDNYNNGLPLLRRQFEYMKGSDEPILIKIGRAYEPVRRDHPQTRVGILADMSAAAIFLHLSYMG
jgi:hypothetical protein